MSAENVRNDDDVIEKESGGEMRAGRNHWALRKVMEKKKETIVFFTDVYYRIQRTIFNDENSIQYRIEKIIDLTCDI